MTSSDQTTEDFGTGSNHKLKLYTAYVCPRCTVVYASDEGCNVCDYGGDLDEFEVCGA